MSSAKRICWEEGFPDTLAEGGLIRRERFDWSLVYFRALDSSSRRNACLENRTYGNSTRALRYFADTYMGYP